MLRFFRFDRVLTLLIHECMPYFYYISSQKLLLDTQQYLKNSIILAQCDFFYLTYFHIQKVIFKTISSFSPILKGTIKLKILLNPVLYVLKQISILNLNIFSLILNFYQSNPDVVFPKMKTLSQLSCIDSPNYSYFFAYLT
jgi:hypothetical protein